jgi:hypothetical protein
MDQNKLLKALDDETNESLLNFTSDKLLEMNLNILKELHLPKDKTLEFLKKIQNYKYIDEINELKPGTFIRWICLINPEDIKLQKGAIFCEVKIKEEGVFIIYKNFNSEKRYQLKMDECLIFQKLTNNELILLSALDHLAK